MKKKLSFLLAAMMLVINMAFTGMAAETKATFTDVSDGTLYSEAILAMSKLGIVNGYTDNTFKPEAGITRAEFTAVITRAMGIANNVGGVSPFTDVAADHWALKNIIAATDRGITNGMGDGTFAPDANVTYEQAVKMIVCALNYTLSAEAAGGWPDGYFNQGIMLGLTKGVAASTVRTAAAPRGVVCQLMYNTLDVKVADINKGTPTDDTFLNKFMNMEMETGKVVGVEEDVTGECSPLARDEMAVQIKNGDIIFIDFAGYAEAADILPYLGQEAMVFYKLASSGGMNELVILDAEITKNETEEIESELITDYSDGEITYYGKSGRKAKADFDVDDVTVFYNKKAVDSGVDGKLEKWLNPADEEFIYGSVKLTDSGADGTVDMVEIMDYDYLVALRAPSSSDYTVTNKMKIKAGAERIISDVTLNPDKKSYSFTIHNQDGAKLETTGIKANNVVLVAESENEDAYTVLVSSKTVDGSISAFSEDEGTIQIDGKEYNISKDCITYLEEQDAKLENGAKGKFYLDAFGTVAYATLNVSTDSTTTMYLITAYYDEDTEGGQLRGFVPGSGYKTYPLDEKVRLNGKGSSPEAVIEHLRDNALNFNGKEYNAKENSNANQLIKIELSGTKVKDVATIDVHENGTTKDTSGVQLYHVGPKKYTYNSNTFTADDDKFFTNSSTVYISIPNDRTVTTGYYKRTASYFDKTSKYTLEPINVNDSKIAEIVLIYTGVSEVGVYSTTPISVLAEEPKDDASGDEVMKKFKLYTNNNTLVEKIVDEEEDVEDMVAGDIFQYATSNEGRATDVQPKISYEDIYDVLKGDEYDWTAKKFTFETSYKRQDNSGEPYSAAYMFNLVSIDEDGSNLIVTQEGFEDGELPKDVDTELIQINDSTKFLKMNEDGDELLTIDEESEVELTIDDLAAAEYVGDKCSKIAVITHNSDYAKLIIIYE